MSKETMLMMLL